MTMTTTKRQWVSVARYHHADDNGTDPERPGRGFGWALAAVRRRAGAEARATFDRWLGCACGCSPGWRIQVKVPVDEVDEVQRTWKVRPGARKRDRLGTVYTG